MHWWDPPRASCDTAAAGLASALHHLSPTLMSGVTSSLAFIVSPGRRCRAQASSHRKLCRPDETTQWRYWGALYKQGYKSVFAFLYLFEMALADLARFSLSPGRFGPCLTAICLWGGAHDV
jgi:hypothetical protein